LLGKVDNFKKRGENKINNYKHKWKYNDNERPQGCCYDCRMKYGEFPVLIIPNYLWEFGWFK